MQAVRRRRSGPAPTVTEGKGRTGELYFLVCPPHFCLPELLHTEQAERRLEHELLQKPGTQEYHLLFFSLCAPSLNRLDAQCSKMKFVREEHYIGKH